jgi:hypothetical protein
MRSQQARDSNRDESSWHESHIGAMSHIQTCATPDVLYVLPRNNNIISVTRLSASHRRQALDDIKMEREKPVAFCGPVFTLASGAGLALSNFLFRFFWPAGGGGAGRPKSRILSHGAQPREQQEMANDVVSAHGSPCLYNDFLSQLPAAPTISCQFAGRSPVPADNHCVPPTLGNSHHQGASSNARR